MRKTLAGLTAAAAAIALAASGLGIAQAAHAAPAPVYATTAACGTGSSAVFNAAGQPVLTVGTAPAGSCGAPAGSTTDPAYAKIVLAVAGEAVPTTEPSFQANEYTNGSPRLVIDLANGHKLWGYPGLSGLNGTSMAWEADNTGTYTSYAAALTAVGGSSTTVLDAYLIADTDQAAGTADTITALTWNGAAVVRQPAAAAAVPVLSHGHVVSASGTTVVLAWDQTVSTTANVVTTTYGPMNGHTAKVRILQATLHGLKPGHSGILTIQPTVNGVPVGKAGKISFRLAA